MSRKVILAVLGIICVVVIAVIVTSEWYTGQPEFCGSCHPAGKPYGLWAKAGHMDVKCIDCHFARGKESFLMGLFRGMEHFPASLSSSADATEVQKLSTISKIGCAASGCHAAEKFPDGKVKLTENFPSSHKPHEDRIIEGAVLNCGTCHLDIKSDKDHGVSQEACYLCFALAHIYKAAFR